MTQDTTSGAMNAIRYNETRWEQTRGLILALVLGGVHSYYGHLLLMCHAGVEINEVLCPARMKPETAICNCDNYISASGILWGKLWNIGRQDCGASRVFSLGSAYAFEGCLVRGDDMEKRRMRPTRGDYATVVVVIVLCALILSLIIISKMGI